MTRVLAPILLLTILPIACNRNDPSPNPTSTTQKPASIPPIQSTLTISEKPYTFPPAEIIFNTDSDTLHVQLFSQGASPEGDHDGYYFDLILDIPDLSQLDGTACQIHSNSNDRSDSPTAITVNNGANQLQPRDVTITFHSLSPTQTEIRINGSFNVFPSRSAATSIGAVPVQATLAATRRTIER